MDAHGLAGDADAYRILEHTTDTDLPHLPGKAIEHGQSWRPGTDESYTWDESYTMPENLFWRTSAGRENDIARWARSIWMMIISALWQRDAATSQDAMHTAT
jgi:hypothetical protein